MITSLPSVPVYLDTTSGTLMLVHLDTSAPMTNSPNMEADSVSLRNRLPDMSDTISVPFSYPYFKPYHLVASRQTLKRMKNSSGPTILPVRAMEAPSAARTGRKVPQ
ncbi:hypothetical protein D3C87_1794850 [compost metagenome]